VFVIAKPLGFVNPPIWLGRSSSHSGATVTVARRLSLLTCLPTMAEDYFDAAATVGVVDTEAPNVGKVGATIVPEAE
jgi:hypothetical protein